MLGKNRNRSNRKLQKVQPNNGNSTVSNVDNTALIQEIKALVENATGANCKYTERKIQELTKTLSENLGVVNDNVKGVPGKNKPDFVAIQNESIPNLIGLCLHSILLSSHSLLLHITLSRSETKMKRMILSNTATSR